MPLRTMSLVSKLHVRVAIAAYLSYHEYVHYVNLLQMVYSTVHRKLCEVFMNTS